MMFRWLLVSVFALMACDGAQDWVDTDSFKPSLVRVGDGYAAAWEHQVPGEWSWVIHFGRWDAAGAAVGAPVALNLAVDGDASDAALAFDGAGFGVAWQSRSGAGSGVWFAKLDAAGAVTSGPQQIGALPAGYADRTSRPRLRWTGAGFALVWARHEGDGYSTMLARFDAAGAATGDPVVIAAPADGAPRSELAWDGAALALVLTDRHGDDALLRTFTPAGGPVADLSLPAQGIERVSVAWSGQAWGVAWEGRAMAEVSFAAVAPDGTASTPVVLSDVQGALLAAGAAARQGGGHAAASIVIGAFAPRVLVRDGDWVVVWSASLPGGVVVQARSVDAAGVAAPSAQALVGPPATLGADLGLALDGGTLAVAWHGSGSRVELDVVDLAP